MSTGCNRVRFKSDPATDLIIVSRSFNVAGLGANLAFGPAAIGSSGLSRRISLDEYAPQNCLSVQLVELIHRGAADRAVENLRVWLRLTVVHLDGEVLVQDAQEQVELSRSHRQGSISWSPCRLMAPAAAVITSLSCKNVFKSSNEKLHMNTSHRFFR